MLIIEDEIVTIDCDDTLVLWPENHPEKYPMCSFSQPSEYSIPIVDPYDNSTNHLIPHEKHISLLKKWKGRGYTIIVWSAGGSQWALSVVQALNLEKYVNLVISKPTKYLDDLSCEKWMGQRVYLK